MIQYVNDASEQNFQAKEKIKPMNSQLREFYSKAGLHSPNILGLRKVDIN